MRSEAELAGVLVHEISYVLKKHHLRAVQKSVGFALIGDLVSASDAGRNTQAKEAFVHIGQKLYASGLYQSNEYKADRLDVVIAACAGYDACGLPAVLQMLEAQSTQYADHTLLFKTHPAPGACVTALDKLMMSRFDTLPGLTGRPVGGAPEGLRQARQAGSAAEQTIRNSWRMVTPPARGSGRRQEANENGPISKAPLGPSRHCATLRTCFRLSQDPA